MKDYIYLLRPQQYLKNLFIFLPLFFGLKITDVSLLLKGFMAFIAFCSLASSVYVFNDYYDIQEDRIHAKKKNRPLASGRISGKMAVFLMIILSLGGFTAAIMLKASLFYVFLIYFLLNIGYTLKLKHISIIDTFIIGIGFVLRLFVGAYSTNMRLSMWIIMMTFLLAVFMALGKRRDDVLIYLENGIKTRKVIDGYDLDFLNSAMMIMVSVLIVCYIMYTVSSEVVTRLHTDKLYLTVVFVILGLFRYLQIAFVEKKSGGPTEILIKDRFIQLCILGWVISFFFLIYR